MKINIFCFIVVFVTNVTNLIAQENFAAFLNYFTKTKLPIESRLYMSRKREADKILPKNIALKFLFRNDKDRMQYFFENVDMETQKVTFSGNLEYVVGAAECLINKKFIFVTYEMSKQQQEPTYFLASFTKEGKLCDSLLILSSNSVNEFNEWTISRVYENRILVFHYTTEYLQAYKTNINLQFYFIDESSGRFTLQKELHFQSNCSIDDFNIKEEKCISEDPYYKDSLF